MRGRPSKTFPGRNSGVSAPQTSTKSIPAPVGGWNTVAPLAAMPATDAAVMANFWPTYQGVELRKGFTLTRAVTAGFNVNRLFVYRKITGQDEVWGLNQTTSVLVRMDSGGANFAVASGFSNAEYVNFSNSGGNFLSIIVGASPYYYSYNGAWSAPALTGVPAGGLFNISSFKRRHWFCGNFTNGDLNAYYLAVDAIAGALTAFPLAATFTRGGGLCDIATWTVDGGTGSDDYIVFLTTQGEVAVYQGTDPATDFALVGVYYVGSSNCPTRAFIKYGGDLVYLGIRGLFPLSKLLLSATLDRSITISAKIANQFYIDDLVGPQPYVSSALLYSAQNALLVNCYDGVSSTPQLLMNLETKAWTKFTGWDFSDFVVANNIVLYGVKGNKLYRAWFGNTDTDFTSAANVAIVGTCSQAWVKNDPNYKVEMVKPVITATGAATYTFAIDTDFQTEDAAVLALPSLSPATAHWISLPNRPGNYHSFRMQISSSTAAISWSSTNFALKGTGIL